MNKLKIGFIGVGHMGYGMAKNLIKNFNVYVLAHKNRVPIIKLVNQGAKEVKSYKELFETNLDCLMMCVTNTTTACVIAETIKGRGVKMMENSHAWHRRSPNKDELDLILEELN